MRLILRPTLALLALCQAATSQDIPPKAIGDTFARASAAELDSLYGPLVYLMTAAEHGVYRSLSLAERRAFLRTFWSRRDPTPGTPGNPALETFYGRVRRANRQFTEGGATAIPGWRTDRGRVYIRYGRPDQVLSRPRPGSTNPYEVWKYTWGQPRKYVFFDVTRFGNFTLIWTDDLSELGKPDWKALLGGEALEDVLRF